MSSTIPNTTAPAGNDYGGDEISALVLDPGYSSVRAGFAGEDVPKSICSSYYGRTAQEDGTAHFTFGDSIYQVKAGKEILNPMGEDGVVDDWDAAIKLWEYTLTSRLLPPNSKSVYTNGLNDDLPKDSEDVDMGLDDDGDADENSGGMLGEHPLLLTEPSHNPGKLREKSIETAIESWRAPAFWMVKSGVSAAFAAGKASALVVDVGAASTNITAVHDGLVLKKSTQRTPLAGNFVSDQIRMLLSQQSPPVTINPHYRVKRKQAVEPNMPANAEYRELTGITQSFARLHESRVLTSMKEYVVQTFPQGPLARASSETLQQATHPYRSFEFPDGYNMAFGVDRFKVCEGLFDPSAAFTDAEHPNQPDADKSIIAAIKTSLEQVDVDVRFHLLQNVVVTGGSTLLLGFTERLNNELQTLYPSARVRISAPGNAYERMYGPWIGGSILASLGTFHQMWISKKEYDENGANIVEKRCK